jgi:hypothetical protein
MSCKFVIRDQKVVHVQGRETLCIFSQVSHESMIFQGHGAEGSGVLQVVHACTEKGGALGRGSHHGVNGSHEILSVQGQEVVSVVERGELLLWWPCVGSCGPCFANQL